VAALASSYPGVMRRGDRGPSWAEELRAIARSSLAGQGVDVECPRCSAKATVSRSDSSRRLVCTSCGLTRSADGGTAWPDGSEAVVRDPWFGAPLWFQGPCAGHTLWAVNEDHLAYIEHFIESDRSRDRSSSKLFNSALAEQFPKWMVQARNRPDVLKAISRFRERCDEGRSNAQA
jgi:ribosomal protein S27E